MNQSTALAPSPQPSFLGIEIGGTKLQAVVGSAQGAIHERRRLAVDRQLGGAGIRRTLESLLPQLLSSFRPAAVGVGFGGPVDGHSGRICCSHQIEGWSDFPLREWLHAHTQLPVGVENDANTAALGEALCGAGQDANPVFYVTLGSGVGGGLVVNRRIYHGQLPGEAEIGHVRLDRQGTIVEHRCSGWAVDARIRRLVEGGSESPLARLAREQPGGEARHLGAALAVGDPVAQGVLHEVADDLAFALSHVTHLIHPERIVLGGGLALLGEPLRQAVNQALPGFLMDAFLPGPSVRLSLLREDAVPTGALLLAAEALSARERAS